MLQYESHWFDIKFWTDLLRYTRNSSFGILAGSEKLTNPNAHQIWKAQVYPAAVHYLLISR